MSSDLKPFLPAKEENSGDARASGRRTSKRVDPKLETRPAIALAAEDEDAEFTVEDRQLSLQQISSIRFRQAERSRFSIDKLPLKIFAILFSLILAVSFFYYQIRINKNFNSKILHSVQTAQTFLDKKEFGFLTRKITENILKKSRRELQIVALESSNKSSPKISCASLINEALNRRFVNSLDQTGYYLLLNCQLFHDQPRLAVRGQLKGQSLAETSLNPTNDWESLPMNLIRGEALHRLKSIGSFDARSFSTCKSFTSRPDCLVKFLDISRQYVGADLSKYWRKMIESTKEKSPLLRVWVGYAVGLNAIKIGKNTEAEVILGEAAKFFPALYDPFLEREIFRLRVLNAFLNSDSKLMRSVWKTKPVILIKQDKNAFIDSFLLRNLLVKSGQKSLYLNDFFGYPESFQRFIFDLRFIRIVVEQAIRNGSAEEALGYLNRIQEAQVGINSSDGDWLHLLRARLLLANSRGIEALEVLKLLEKKAFKSPDAAHLKGLALLQSYSSRPHYLLAQAEFQAASNLDPRPEHFFALIVTFLESRELAKAEITLQFWSKTKPKPRSDFWQNLALALIRDRQGRSLEVRKLLTTLDTQRPEDLVIRRILINLTEDPNYLKDHLVKRLLSVLPIDGPLSPLAVYW